MGTKYTQFRKSRKFFCAVIQGLKAYVNYIYVYTMTP
jgi:hypothetical protein